MKRRAIKKWEDLDRVYVVAEAGLGHDGSKEQAIALVSTAAESGADAVKFQFFDADQLIHKEKLQTELNLENGEWFEKLKLYNFNPEWLSDIQLAAQNNKIDLFFTPLYLEAVDFLEAADNPIYKIASGDITFTPMLDKIARTQKPVIISCGLGTPAEIAYTVQLFTEKQSSVMLLYCVSKYPTPVELIDFSIMKNLSDTYKVPVGFSDHTQSLLTPSLAVASGAILIEKHFTLSRYLPGGDHSISLDPPMFKQMVQNIRETETIIAPPSLEAIEQNNAIVTRERKLALRSLYTTKTIKSGDTINKTNSMALRPNLGISPFSLMENYEIKTSKSIQTHRPIIKEELE